MGGILGVSESACSSVQLLYTKRSSSDLCIQTNRDLALSVRGFASEPTQFYNVSKQKAVQRLAACHTDVRIWSARAITMKCTIQRVRGFCANYWPSHRKVSRIESARMLTVIVPKLH
jgi:hypothetical protein